MLHVSMAQGGNLPDNQAYLDGCSTVTVFKNDKFLSRLRAVAAGIKINCNVWAAVTNMKGKFGQPNAWYLPDGIADILSMHELEKMYIITYDSWEGFYIVHTPRGEVRFYKDTWLEMSALCWEFPPPKTTDTPTCRATCRCVGANMSATLSLVSSSDALSMSC